jgi:hypothetical protein
VNERSRYKLPQFLAAFVGIVVWLAVAAVNADEKAQLLEDLVRGTAKVGDKVPLRDLEQVSERLTRSNVAEEAIQAELRRSGKLEEGMDKAAQASARSSEVLRLLQKAARHLDPAIVRRVEQLDQPGRESALVLARGGEEIGRSVPDLAARGRFLAEGGPETVAAIGLHGRDAAEGV